MDGGGVVTGRVEIDEGASVPEMVEAVRAVAEVRPELGRVLFRLGAALDGLPEGEGLALVREVRRRLELGGHTEGCAREVARWLASR